MPVMITDKKPLKWCAIYTRKSTDENMGGDFTSLDSQREYCEAFIKSREGEGWRAFPVEYNYLSAEGSLLSHFPLAIPRRGMVN